MHVKKGYNYGETPRNPHIGVAYMHANEKRIAGKGSKNETQASEGALGAR